MLKLAVFCVVLACVMADCTNLQRIKVKQQLQQAYGTGDKRQGFSVALFRSIFIQAPEVREYFKTVGGDDENSPQFRAHAGRVISGLSAAFDLLDAPETLDGFLAHLKTKHDNFGIPASVYRYMKNSLLKLVPAALGRCFDADAMSACFDVITDGLTD